MRTDKRVFTAAMLAGALAISSCSAARVAPHDEAAPIGTATLPMYSAWFAGKRVYYITTDVSDRDVAQRMGANLAPRLTDGVPETPKPPELKTVLERVYATDDPNQAKIFASIPQPVGPASANRAYSPLWRLVTFDWVQPEHRTPLRSEGDVLEAAARGWVRLDVTDVVLNCPVVAIEEGGTPLRNVTVQVAARR